MYTGTNPTALRSQSVIADATIELMKKKAFEKVEQHFSWSKIAWKTRQVYQAIQEEAQKSNWERASANEGGREKLSLLNAFAARLKLH